MKNKIAAGLACVLAANLLASGPLPVIGGYASVQAAGETAALQTTFVPATTAVSLRPALYATFASAVKRGDTPASKFFTIKKKADDATVLKIAGDKLRISADGLRVDLPLEAAVWTNAASTSLDAQTEYYVLADSGILQTVPQSASASAQPWTGVDSKTTWTFRTDASDTAAPKQLFQSPKKDAIGIAVNTDITLDFDESVYYEDADVSNVKIIKADDPTAQGIALTAEQLKGKGTSHITISGLALDNFTTYEVSYPSGFFKDAGNLPAAEGKWKFRTVSKIDKAPTVSFFSPRPGNAGASVTDPLTMTFSEAVKQTSGEETIRIYRLDTNKLVQTVKASTLTPDADNPALVRIPHDALTRGTTYYVMADPGTFVDLDGRPYAGTASTSEWTFTTTGDALSLTALSPANGAAGAAKGNALKMSFSRAVYPSSLSGTTLTVKRGDGTVHESLPLDSDRISGFGTTALSVSLSKALEAGYVYTVTLADGSLQDAEGNAFPNANRPLNWTFSTVTDGQSISLVSMTPVDRSIDVALDTPIRVSFNRDIATGSGKVGLYKSGGSEVPAQVSVNPSNPRELLIVPGTKLEQGTSYYVDLAPASVTDAVSTGIQFAGLSGKDKWSFRTVSADTTVPTIQGATMSSSGQIRLMYNKQLDAVSYPLLSSYTVTVNGEKRALSDISVRGESVYLTLGTGAAVGQDVKLSYTPDVRPLRDLNGNKAAALSSYAVTNNIDTALPKPVEGTAYSRSVQLTFANLLGAVDSRAYGQFSVTADGGYIGVEGITSGSKTLTLYTTSDIPEGSVVKVSYSPGAYPVKDYLGQNLSAFNAFHVRNLLDRRPPEFVSAELSGKELILNYNEPLASDNLPGNSQFSVLANGLPVYVTNVAVDGSKVRLTLASSLIAANGVSVSYVPGVLKLTDLNLNAAGYLNLQPVGATAGTSGIRSATVNGSALQITFTGALQESTSQQSSQFSVFVDESFASVESSSITGSTVSVNLITPVKAGQKVQVSYSPGTNPLKNTGGTQVPAFTRLAVDNLTGAAGSAATGASLPVMSGAEFGKSMSVLGSSSAAASNSSTKYNQDTHTYTLSASALQSALEASLTAGTRAVVFEAPSTDNSAVVNIPLPILTEMHKKSSNLSVAVRYKNALYELPLKNLQALATASQASAYVQVVIEPVPAASSISTRSMLMDNKAQLLSDPVDIRVTPLTSGMAANTSAPAVTGNYYFKLSGASPAASTSVVYEDIDSARPFFVPSYVTSSATGAVVSGTTVGNRVLTPVTSSYAYSDMTSHWAKDTVNGLASKFILETRNGSAFSPNTTITRGSFAEYIARGMGLPYDTLAANQFKDANYSRYLGGAIGAAVNAGIINGNTDGTFRANDPITREQMAAMMVRALNYAGVDTTLNGSTAGVLSAFKDSGQITFTTEAAKAVSAGIIKGGSNGKFNPKGNATQAEAATMLQRVLQEAGYLN
ncbi:Ig-like domain-containing protein [Saccharibacillus alkalitolerans]|uniref:SLH domain-containing protein n=1 Tax=Saccharibacillus alkalitolerans TaxID=2705290 RepID=A0ABX0F834_9BACL|nr:Ig-like domain-containing protein [Saccharibacillus alkalitolerans]NGZ76134.1 hypothetical protein [Saccharibacillus alkalitolerans]